MADSPTPTLLFHRRGALMLLLSGRVAMSAEDWTHYVLSLEALGKEHPQVSLLVVGDDVGPSAKQRDELVKHAPRGIRTSVVTASVLGRSITTLLGWLDPNIRCFAPRAIDAALDYLAVPRDERSDVLKLVAAMRVRLSGIGVESDEAAAALLEQTAIDPKDAVVQSLSKLRTEIASRRRT